MVYTEHLLFFSEGLNIWYMTGRSCLCEQAPIKTLGTESPMSFSGRQHTTYAVNLVAGEVKCTTCDSTGRILLAVCVSFLRLHPMCLFPLADFALYPSVVINHSGEYNYMFSPMSPCKSLKFRGGLEDSPM